MGRGLFLIFFLATLALRLPVLLARGDSWFVFEVHCGTIATALVDGLDLDWATLPIISHVRGNVVNGLLLWPLYALFGPGALVMKLVPLLWHATTVALAAQLLARHAGRRAAAYAGTLLLLGPPALQKLSLLGLASHLESMLFFLLALGPWLHMFARRDFGPRPAFALGLAIGGAAFFHVQALLPCLILLGLLLASETPALWPRGLAALGAGWALGSAPAWFFEGGNLEILGASLGGDASAGVSEDLARGELARTPASKLAGLLSGDFARALEYDELPGGLGRVAGVLVAVLLAALPLVAAWAGRGRLRDLVLRVLLRRPASAPGPLPPLLLHALAMVALFLVSHAFIHPDLSTGATNRHLAPLWFSLLVLSGLGLGALADRGRHGLALALLALVALPGALGVAALSRSTEAARLPQRGECYEWFRGQLVHAAGGRSSPAQVQLVARVDRGDARFRNLRFRLQLPQPAPDDPALAERLLHPAPGVPSDLTCFALTGLGRRLGAAAMAARPGAAAAPRLFDPAFLAALDRMPPPERSALLHGVGLACEPPRTEEGGLDAFRSRLRGLLSALRPAHAARVAEGYGFQLGLGLNARGSGACELVAREAGALTPQLQAFCTGLGWGFRQRYRDPPATLPDGLGLLDCLPPEGRQAFGQGYTGALLPPESVLLEG